jgi:hypothetical protein
MDSATTLLVLLAAGVNFGWQPAEHSADGYEYIVQVEPELLDALRRGESVPIESNVPPEVGPIRKVSLVVGRGELPRDSVSAVQRTAYFAGQAGWTPDPVNSAPTTGEPAAASTYDRYGQLPTATASGNSPPPSVLERAQAAVTETGTALHEGVDAGIQAANQQFSRAGEQVVEATRNASQEFSQQLQGMVGDPVAQMQSYTNSTRGTPAPISGSADTQRQQVTNPFATSAAQPAATGSRPPGGVAPPPWPPAGLQNSQSLSNTLPVDQTIAPGMSRTGTQSGWTSIGPNVAAPPLIIPPLATTPTSNTGALTRMATGGPTFPAPSGLNRDASGIAQPNERAQAAPASGAATDWADGWGTNAGAPPATIGRAGNTPATGSTSRGANLVPVQQLPGQSAQTAQQNTTTWDDPWGRDPWAQTSQTAPAGQPVPNTRSEGTTTMRDAAAEWQLGTNPANANAPQNVPVSQTLNGISNNHPISGAGLSPTTSQAPSNALAEQQPWLPLLLVSLSLMGSLSANLFLGWSYLDARQKYRSLVRKTADTFRRVTSTAA